MFYNSKSHIAASFLFFSFMKTILFSILFVFGITACNNSENNNSISQVSDSAIFKNEVLMTGLGLIPEIDGFDSLQVLYYDNPDGDPKRYTRFFTYISSNDSALINATINNLDQPFQEHMEVKGCRSEGKIYLYKNNDPVKTLYFSTRCNTCCHLYYIKNGMFYYMEINPHLSELLHVYKASAIKPEKSTSDI